MALAGFECDHGARARPGEPEEVAGEGPVQRQGLRPGAADGEHSLPRQQCPAGRCDVACCRLAADEALLPSSQVGDPAFWTDEIQTLSFVAVPELQDEILVAGYSNSMHAVHGSLELFNIFRRSFHITPSDVCVFLPGIQWEAIP